MTHNTFSTTSQHRDSNSSPTQVENVKFGIVGCGRISKKHLEAISQLESASLAAVCDIIPERAKTAAAKYHAASFTDYHEMLEKHPEIDIVNVLTPSGNHAKDVIALAPYRKHIVVEKPMALVLTDAEDMIRVCAECGVRLFVVQQNRYNLPVQKLREAVVQQRFRKMVLGTVRVRWCRTQDYYDLDSWRGTWASDGGVIANQASHHIDLLTWMMGDVESVFSYTATRLVNIEADDSAVAVLKFTSGALGVIEATTATRPKDLEGSLSILGEGGTVEIGGFAVNEMKVWNFVDAKPGDERVLQEYRENPPNVYGFGHKEFLSCVVNAIDTGQGGVVDGLEALKSLTLINAIYESVETGKEVKLRFRPRWAKLGR